MQLHYKYSFLVATLVDESEDEKDETEMRSKAKRRSRSEDPAYLTSCHAETDAYVASLNVKVSQKHFRLSPGSIGHPQFCCRPCVYQKFGGCADQFCCFCHEPHDRLPKLDKAQQQIVQKMTELQLMKALLLGPDFRHFEDNEMRTRWKQLNLNVLPFLEDMFVDFDEFRLPHLEASAQTIPGTEAVISLLKDRLASLVPTRGTLFGKRILDETSEVKRLNL